MELARSKIWKRVLDIIYPVDCFLCGRPLDPEKRRYACQDCSRDYFLIHPPFCSNCGYPYFGNIRDELSCSKCLENEPVYHEGRCLIIHSGAGAELIHELKYHQGLYLTHEIDHLLRQADWLEPFFSMSYLVPVPLHARRKARRGFNQAQIIAQCIAAVFPVAGVVNLIERTRATKTQTRLSREDRRKNVKGAFRPHYGGEQPARDCRMILIDDVATTGSTLNAAAETLHAEGYSNISAFTLAHG